MEGVSWKRTDFGDAATGLPRRDFLRKEELEAVIRGRSEARAKSEARAGVLGWWMDLEEVLVGLPTNWAARSLYCVCNVFSVSASVRDSLYSPVSMCECVREVWLYYPVSPASCSRIRSFVRPSSPSRSDSRDRDMCPS